MSINQLKKMDVPSVGLIMAYLPPLATTRVALENSGRQKWAKASTEALLRLLNLIKTSILSFKECLFLVQI